MSWPCFRHAVVVMSCCSHVVLVMPFCGHVVLLETCVYVITLLIEQV